MLRPHTEYHFPSLGLTIVNNDSSKRNMCFFCRRILLEYARSAIRDGEEVISDVFQYLVNQPSDNVIITIPGYSVPGQFDEAFIKDNVGYEYSYSGCRTDSKVPCFSYHTFMGMDTSLREINLKQKYVASLVTGATLNHFHPEFIKWTFPSLNLYMSIVKNRDASQKSKQNDKQCRS